MVMVFAEVPPTVRFESRTHREDFQRLFPQLPQEGATPEEIAFLYTTIQHDPRQRELFLKSLAQEVGNVNPMGWAQMSEEDPEFEADYIDHEARMTGGIQTVAKIAEQDASVLVHEQTLGLLANVQQQAEYLRPEAAELVVLLSNQAEALIQEAYTS